MPTLSYVTQIVGNEKVVTKLEHIDSNIKKHGKSGQDSGKKVESAYTRMRSVLGSVDKIAAGLGVTFGIIGAVRWANSQIDATLTFEKAMQQSLSIMGDVSEAMRGEMTEAAREVGRTTTFSATQAGEAYFFLASAGLDAKQSIGALPLVTKFAQAGQFDLARATDLLTDAQSALGLTVRDNVTKNMENMIRVSDVLVKANTLSNASVSQFSEALTNRGGPALRLVNKDLEEGVAILAAWADQGVKGSEAGVRLDIVLRDLARASLNNREEFDAFGINIFDTTGNLRNMADIIEEMENVLIPMSDETRRATLMQLGFQDRSIAATSSLLGMSEAIRNYEIELRDAGGTTELVANKQIQNASDQLRILAGAVTDGAVAFLSKFSPAVAAGADKLTELIQQARRGEGPIIAVKNAVVALSFALGAASAVGLARIAAKAVTAIKGLKASFLLLRASLVLAMPMAWIVAVPALAATAALSIFHLRDAWIAQRDALEELQRTEIDATEATARLILKLEDLGFVIKRRAGEPTEEFEERVRALAGSEKVLTETHRRLAEELFAGAPAFQGMAELLTSIKEETGGAVDANEEFNNSVDEVVKKVTQQVDGAGLLEAALERLQAKGIPLSMVFNQLGGAIAGTAAELRALGQEIPQNIARMNQLLANMNIPLPGVSGVPLASMLAPNLALAGETTGIPSPQFSGTFTEDVLGASAAARRNVEIGLARQNVVLQIEKETQEAVMALDRERTDALEKSFGEIYDVFLEKGKSAWSSLGNFVQGLFHGLGRDLFSSLGATLMEPLKEKFDKLSGFISGSLFSKDKKTGALSGLFSGLGGTVGSIAGGIATAGIGTAIGFVIQALSGLFNRGPSKQFELGENLKDELILPIAARIQEIANQTNTSFQAGDLTSEQAQAALDDVDRLWTALREGLDAVAAEGAWQAQVVRDRMTNPEFQDALRLFDQTTANLAEHAGELARQELRLEQQARLTEIDDEMETVLDQLSAALIGKLDFLDAAIAQSTQSIERWQEAVQDINVDIEAARMQLQDAGFWQERYTRSIQDAENAFRSAVQRRMAIEDQIGRLTVQVERDRLKEIIRTSDTAGDVAKAEAGLADLEERERKRQIAGRIDELAQLRDALEDAVRLEEEARIALEERKRVTEETIALEQIELRDFIASKTAERRELQLNIAAERERVSVLELGRASTLAGLEELGVSRRTELEQINDTIDTLVLRGQALEAERSALAGLLEIADDFPRIFDDIRDALDNPVVSQFELPEGTPIFDSPQQFPDPSPSDRPPGSPPGVLLDPDVPSLGDLRTNPETGRMERYAIFAPGIRPGWVPFVGSFAVGNPFVPRDGMAMVHRGEAIIPAHQNETRTSGDTIVHFEIAMNGGSSRDEHEIRRLYEKEIIPLVIDSLDTNRGQVKTSFQRHTRSGSRRLIDK